MPRRLLFAFLCLALAAEPCLAKGRIRGRIVVPETATDAGGAAGKSSGPQASLNAVVYLEEIPAKIEKKLAKKARKTRRTIVQENLQFQPRLTVVTAGDSVRIRNLDNVYHSAFSVSTAQRFDLGKYPPGRISMLAFETPGVVNLHCDIHPRMLGFVVVLRNHAFVVPDTTGRFELPPKLPKGTYTLNIWHPRYGNRSRTVEMPKKGNLDVELRF